LSLRTKSHKTGRLGLLPLLEQKRVVVCAGPGGVGKTTTSAAIGLAAARRGRRVVALTVDPARRLADSLGLRNFEGQAQEVDLGLWAPSAGAGAPGGRLTVMMLDAKQTFDELVTRHSPSAEVAERILNNGLYKHISSYLAGAHEYMAMEKLLSVKDDPSFDLIVLDTPPSESALDFLTAPERLLGAVDGAVMRWLSAAFDPKRGFSMQLLAKGVSRILATMGRITGREFLDQMARFVADFNSLFGGFRERAERVSKSFRGADIGFVLVTAPSREAVDDSLRLARYLASERMSVGAFVVNRVHPGFTPSTPSEILATLEQRGLALPAERLSPLAEKLAVLEAARLRAARADADSVGHLTSELRAVPRLAQTEVLSVAELVEDVQSIAGLLEMSRALCPDTAAPAA
jgi:anion-transporting  ArsA/GET3 family ATPase